MMFSKDRENHFVNVLVEVYFECHVIHEINLDEVVRFQYDVDWHNLH
jgi:hypothetical protein